jgi:SPP1 family predicted phage head-tail adaptor
MYLPHRARIEQVTVSNPGTTGARTETWSVYAHPWGHFKTATVREFVEAGVTNSKVNASWTMRSRDATGVEQSMRLLFGDRTYNIEGGPLLDPRSGNEYCIFPLSEVRSD